MKRILLLALPLLTASCAMSVKTELQQTLTPRVTADKVHLYNVYDTVPDEAELIGNVSVRDGGFSANCGLDKVVGLAKNKTAECGGNILQLTNYKPPSRSGSTCHQIEGRMLWMPDTLNWDSAHNAEPMAIVLDNTTVELSGQNYQPQKLAKNTFYGSVGFGWITSKIYMPQNSRGSIKNGIDWTFGYDWVSKSKWGVGFKYSGYHSSCIVERNNLDVTITYLAPQLVYRAQFEKWALEERFGIGYYRYDESAGRNGYFVGGLGYNFDFGLEYLLSKNFGLCADFGYIGGRLSGMDDYLPEDTYGGIFRINLLAGVRFHF